MLVIEKYKDELINLIQKETDYPVLFCKINEKIFNSKCENINEVLLSLLDEYVDKIPLTLYEHETLKLVYSKGYRYLAKEDKNDFVFFYKLNPKFEQGIYWPTAEKPDCSCYGTFKFIKKGELWEIDEILACCVVAKDK